MHCQQSCEGYWPIGCRQSFGRFDTFYSSQLCNKQTCYDSFWCWLLPNVTACDKHNQTFHRRNCFCAVQEKVCFADPFDVIGGNLYWNMHAWDHACYRPRAQKFSCASTCSRGLFHKDSTSVNEHIRLSETSANTLINVWSRTRPHDHWHWKC